jgi:hypothetical protein
LLTVLISACTHCYGLKKARKLVVHMRALRAYGGVEV